MNITQFTKQNINECAKLFAEIFSDPPWNEEWSVDSAVQRFSQFIQQPSFIGLLVKESRETVGFIGGFYEFWYDGKIFRLEELFVKKNYQNNGAGTLLLANMQKKLKKSDVKRIYLRTLGNSLQEVIYKKWGFSKNQNTIEMEKII